MPLAADSVARYMALDGDAESWPASDFDSIPLFLAVNKDKMVI
jgi:hypothetical protein